ncbi:mechanosensitive ion channel protein MscL [Bacillus coahuilensis m2-6]|uniref:large conductance mechanosensitive channel protein MscL n=1 Tax=Bacillus coahuilensis TaxID=408580 RepID=UPI00018514CF|nr:large conductance mechanosensitive channel protein MscL [Bacillus coahuilensis]KUP09573.1 mechanosensitive ion channel protein MscL [Bacillus coahuilensis m2-6]
MWKEFKEFAMRGNLIDLAVAIMVGSAFSKIVDSLVQHIMMPVISVLIGGINLQALTLRYRSIYIPYGEFLQSLVDFFIITASIFFIIKMMNRIKGNRNSSYEIQSASELDVLKEIRDLLKEEQKLKQVSITLRANKRYDHHKTNKR